MVGPYSDSKIYQNVLVANRLHVYRKTYAEQCMYARFERDRSQNGRIMVKIGKFTQKFFVRLGIGDFDHNSAVLGLVTLKLRMHKLSVKHATDRPPTFWYISEALLGPTCT